MATAIGREFEFGLLHRASGLDEASAAEGIEGSLLHGVGERVDLTHHRLQAVVYDRFLLPRRKLLHLTLGDALLRAGQLNDALSLARLGLALSGPVASEASRVRVSIFSPRSRPIEIHRVPPSPRITTALRREGELRLDLRNESKHVLAVLPKVIGTRTDTRRQGIDDRLARRS